MGPPLATGGVVSGLGLSLRPTELDGSRTEGLALEDRLLVLRQENDLIDGFRSGAAADGGP